MISPAVLDELERTFDIFVCILPTLSSAQNYTPVYQAIINNLPPYMWLTPVLLSRLSFRHLLGQLFRQLIHSMAARLPTGGGEVVREIYHIYFELTTSSDDIGDFLSFLKQMYILFSECCDPGVPRMTWILTEQFPFIEYCEKIADFRILRWCFTHEIFRWDEIREGLTLRGQLLRDELMSVEVFEAACRHNQIDMVRFLIDDLRIPPEVYAAVKDKTRMAGYLIGREKGNRPAAEVENLVREKIRAKFGR